MGVRTRIKSIIKRLIFKQTDSTQTEPYSPPPSQPTQPREPVQAPSQPEEVAPVATAAKEVSQDPLKSTETETVGANKAAEETPEEAAAEVSIADPAEAVEAAEAAETAQTTETAQEPPSSAAQEEHKSNGIDTTGAFAVYNVANIFPDECPNCGAPSYGNWGYIDKEFVCTSCDTPY